MSRLLPLDGVLFALALVVVVTTVALLLEMIL